MAYEYEKENKEAVMINPPKANKELQEVYKKAQAMDEIEQAYWKSNTPENFAYDFVGIFEKHFSNGAERADDER